MKSLEEEKKNTIKIVSSGKIKKYLKPLFINENVNEK